MATTIYLVPLFLIAIVIFILKNSFSHLKTRMLLALLCILIIGIQFDIIILILPYPIVTLIIFIISLTNETPKQKA